MHTEQRNRLCLRARLEAGPCPPRLGGGSRLLSGRVQVDDNHRGVVVHPPPLPTRRHRLQLLPRDAKSGVWGPGFFRASGLGHFSAHVLACMASCLGSGLTTNFPPTNQPINQPLGFSSLSMIHDRGAEGGKNNWLEKKCTYTLHSKKEKATRKLTWRQRARGSHRQRPVPGSPPSSLPC